MKQTAPDLVADLADTELQRARVFQDLDDETLDARTRQRLLELWARLTQMAVDYRARLGLDAPDKDEGESDEDDLEARVEALDPIFLAHRYGPRWLIRHLRPDERTLWIERYGDEERFEARYGFKLPPTEWPEAV